jgi:hypothetical protein
MKIRRKGRAYRWGSNCVSNLGTGEAYRGMLSPPLEDFDSDIRQLIHDILDLVVENRRSALRRCTMRVETKFLRLCRAGELGDEIDGWRV